ncbi:glycosyltransferase family 1 protein [Cystobasidium minutum MCA 4210]|uniref:glycosyltransferase family 1 protein n=1 Tax=Cystobasidium minutum MCA 4210 TaxID=1397322 RepID=UPI0034CD6927|eukprot:jgi/Rhomi1/143038/e_gw1.3.290.1
MLDRPTYVYILISLPVLFLLTFLRLLQVIKQTHAGERRPRRSSRSTVTTSKASSSNKQGTCRIVAFLGSGGHTGEMIRLLNSLDFAKYTNRTYLISSGDNLSLSKARELEAVKSRGKQHGDGVFRQIPRARRVHQSFLTAPFTTLRSLWTCLSMFALPSLYTSNGSCDLILLNGPGSCVPIVLAAFLPRLLNLHSPQVIYVESFARVNRLSLSGKILQYLVDRFLVQWPSLVDSTSTSSNPYKAKREYKGLLV